MPSYHHHIDKHQLFPIDRRGDTLIVTPKGDPCSFANINFNVEHSALLALLKNGPYRNLLVDLSGSNYFGAKVLGAIAEWSKRVADRDGQVAVCGASSDMRELLQIYGIKDQWPLFPTREAGIRAIAKESSMQSLKRQWKMATFLLCFLAVMTMGYLLQPHYTDRFKNERDYRTIMGIWEQMLSLKEANAPTVEWLKLRGRAKRELEPILEELNERAGSHSAQGRVAQCLLHASQNYILKRFLEDLNRLEIDAPTGPKHEIHWETTAVYLAVARRLMDGKDISGLRFPQPELDSEKSEEDIPPDQEQHSEATEPTPHDEPPAKAAKPELTEPKPAEEPTVPKPAEDQPTALAPAPLPEDH